jgi:hypothetical protein
VKQVPIEGFQMPHIENDPVALGNRPLKNEVWFDDSEQSVTLATGIRESFEKRLYRGVSFSSQHSSLQ